MSKTRATKPIAATMGVAVASTVLAAGSAKGAENPFSLTELDGGYRKIVQAATESPEGKCGEGKCGEGKCGGGGKTMAAEGKCGEGKCGGGGKAMAAEGKCGEGKCGGGGKTMAAEGKCGEGKCGGAK